MKNYLLLSLLVACLISCKKIDELVNPKNGDEINEALLVGTWNVDTVAYGYNEQTDVIYYDTTYYNDGSWEFGPLSKETGANYGVGKLYHRHVKAGVQVTDTLHWYSGDWGSISLDGKRITVFFARKPDGSFDSNSDTHFDFLQKDDKKVRLAGTRGFQFNSGIVGRHHRRFCLSR